MDKRVLPAEVALRSAVRDVEDVVLFDVDCTEPLDFALHELQLVRLEMRAAPSHTHQHHHQHPHHYHTQQHQQQQRQRHVSSSGAGAGAGDDELKLLFLGDVHTDRSQRQTYRPSGFQEPLAAIKVSVLFRNYSSPP